MIDPHLKGARHPVRRDPKTVHDWRLPAAPVAERAIDNLEWQLEYARDELVTDLHGAANDPRLLPFAQYRSSWRLREIPARRNVWRYAMQGGSSPLRDCINATVGFGALFAGAPSIASSPTTTNTQGPFEWIADLDKIIAAVRRGHQVLNSSR